MNSRGGARRREHVLAPLARASRAFLRGGLLVAAAFFLGWSSQPLSAANGTAGVVGRANALRLQGDLEGARSLAQACVATCDAPAAVRAEAVLARIAIAEGHLARGLLQLKSTMTRSATLGQLPEAVADALSTSYYLTTELQDYAGANDVLSRAREWARGYPAGEAEVRYYSGLIAFELGDVRTALFELEQATEGAERFGLERVERAARQQTAILYAQLGRLAEAVIEQREVLSETPPELVCDRADAHGNLAWLSYLAREQGSALPATAIATDLTQADAALKLCADPTRSRTAALNAALFALDQGEVEQATRHLGKVEFHTAATRGSSFLWYLEAQARVSLAHASAPGVGLGELERGELGRARELFARQALLASLWGDADAALRGRVGEGQALQALGERQRATDAYVEAEVLLERAASAIPFDHRDAYFAVRDSGAVQLVDALLAAGEVKRAFLVARRAHNRALISLQREWSLATAGAEARGAWRIASGQYHAARQQLEREAALDWQRPESELEHLRAKRQTKLARAVAILDAAFALLAPQLGDDRTPRLNEETTAPPGEATLLFLKARGRFIVFARLGEAITFTELSSAQQVASAAELAEALNPIKKTLLEAKTIRVVLPPALEHLDVHLMPLSGGPLLLQKPVVYAQGLFRKERAGNTVASNDFKQPRIGVVVNPTLDLPWAQKEAAFLSDSFPEARISFVRGEEATRERTLTLLPALQLFHYAGHAEDDDDHRSGASRLLLAGRSAITAQDLLALPDAPRFVVLSACEAARSPKAGAGFGFSVAHALLLTGTEALLASVEPVADRDSARFQKIFYEELGARQLTTLSAAGFAAVARQAALRAYTQGVPGWGGFRVLVP